LETIKTNFLAAYGFEDLVGTDGKTPVAASTAGSGTGSGTGAGTVGQVREKLSTDASPMQRIHDGISSLVYLLLYELPVTLSGENQQSLAAFLKLVVRFLPSDQGLPVRKSLYGLLLHELRLRCVTSGEVDRSVTVYPCMCCVHTQESLLAHRQLFMQLLELMSVQKLSSLQTLLSAPIIERVKLFTDARGPVTVSLYQWYHFIPFPPLFCLCAAFR
jgi:hypothetical protein